MVVGGAWLGGVSIGRLSCISVLESYINLKLSRFQALIQESHRFMLMGSLPRSLKHDEDSENQKVMFEREEQGGASVYKSVCLGVVGQTLDCSTDEHHTHTSFSSFLLLHHHTSCQMLANVISM